MSEYIYATIGDPVANALGEIFLPRFEVVRCRDCANFDAKRDGCWWFAHAERQPDYSWADEPSDVEPDGFCAWAARRES